jgi:ribulose-5-phosphate 4-epimerase/fuculose-1-phosphate aldolase
LPQPYKARMTLRPILGSGIALLALAAARAQDAGTPAPGARAKAIEDLVAANRILADQGVLDGYGHVSVRDPEHPDRFFLSRSLAPEMVTADDVLEHDLEGNVVSPRAGVNPFLERFIHAGIYRSRPDVNAVVHCHSPSLIPFGVTAAQLRPLYHMSAFLAGGVPVFDIRAAAGDTDMLVRTPELGRALAKTLGAHAVALMRGHGAVIVGADLPHAVFRSVYTEMNARLQAQAMALGKVKYLDEEEARKAEATMGGTVQRPWELWRRKAMK